MSKAKTQRNEEIKAAYASGETMPEIALKHQITKQRVYEILTGYVSPSYRRKQARRRSSKPKSENRILRRYTRFLKYRFTVLKRDNFTCQYCGRKPPDVELHVDHILPKSRGGTDAMANLITACADCNLGKHDVLLTAQAQPRSKRIQPAPFSSNAKIQADLRSQG